MYFKWFKYYEPFLIYSSLIFYASCNTLSTHKSSIEYKIETIQTRPMGGVATDKKDNVYLFHRADRVWNRRYTEERQPIRSAVILRCPNQN